MVCRKWSAGRAVAAEGGVSNWRSQPPNADTFVTTVWQANPERSDIPWYESMTLYRQSSVGDWDSVFSRVATDLQVMR